MSVPLRMIAVPLALAAACAVPAPAQDDSVPPAFLEDSAKAGIIRSVEAGSADSDDSTADSIATAGRRDSLATKMFRRGPYLAVTAGGAFANHSARQLFANHMEAKATEADQRILQRQDPVHVFFPVGVLAGFPVLPYFDVWLRTEHFRYRVTGLAQRDNEPADEYWYVNQAHLAGLGARWLVPVSLFTVNGKSGLYAAYTHFWSFGPTGMRVSGGSLAARGDPAGAGYEVQLGFQQDFDRRWAWIGGLAFSRLTFRSDADWDLILDTAPAEQAEWTLQSMRLVMQFLYQFGR